MSNVLPDGGPPRLFRFVEPGTLPSTSLIATLDKTHNVLSIDREKFQQLSDLQRQIVLTTGQRFVEVATSDAFKAA
jgi:hypothetical protein